MPNSVIALINKRAADDNQPLMAEAFVFQRHDKTFITSLAIDESHLLVTPTDEGADPGAPPGADPGAN